MADQLVLERLQANLTRLHLQHIQSVLLDVIQTANEQGHSHLQVLDALMEEETACKEQRRLDTCLKSSGLPFLKTIDEFDFTFQPHLDRRQVKSLFDLAFLSRKENVIFLGPPGVGKTHLAVALAIKTCQAGQTIWFTSMASLIEKLKADESMGKDGSKRLHSRAALVVVDEVGYTPITREECHLFYRFVATRYEKSSTIITSNKAFSDWAELFHDPVIVTAILDRLLHHSTVVNIKGHSYRLRGKVAQSSAQGVPGTRMQGEGPAESSYDASAATRAFGPQQAAPPAQQQAAPPAQQQAAPSALPNDSLTVASQDQEASDDASGGF